jgi:hypothetical protein
MTRSQKEHDGREKNHLPGVYMKLMQQEIPPIFLRNVHVKAWYVTSSEKMVKKYQVQVVYYDFLSSFGHHSLASLVFLQ